MRLATVTVGVPEFAINATVEHSIVRKPTVFERTMLRLIRRGQDNNDVGSSTIREAFENHLGAQGIPRLLDKSVSALVRLGIINAPETTGQSLLDEPIRSFRLTRDGQDFYNRNTLPSQPTRDLVHLWYAPWRNSLSERPVGKHSGIAPERAFDETKLRPRVPSSLVRNYLEQNPPRFLKSEAQIRDIDAETAEAVGWMNLDIEIHASREGYLELKTRSKEYEIWLQRLEPAVVQDAFLDSVIGTANISNLELERRVLGLAESLELSGEPRSLTVPMVTLPTRGGVELTIRLDPSEILPERSLEDADRVVITCSAPNALPPHIVSVIVEHGRAASCRLEGFVSLTWGSTLRYVPVQADLLGENADKYWTEFSEDLAATLTESPDFRITTVPLLWGSDRPLNALKQRLLYLSPTSALETFEEFLTSASAIGIDYSRDMADQLAVLITEHIEHSTEEPELSVSSVEQWLTLITNSLGFESPRPEIRKALLSKTIPPRSEQEVRQLLALEDNPNLIPQHLLGPPVMAAVLSEVWNDPHKELLADSVASLQRLETFRSAQLSLDRSLGRRNADLRTTGHRVVANEPVGKALRAADIWVAAVDDPELSRVIGDSFPSDLKLFRKRVEAWRAAARENLEPPISSDHIVLVFDSNTLLDHPDSLRDLSSSQIGVIPNRVINELDGLKRSSNKDTAEKARTANRIIDDFRENKQLRFEGARPDLLPSDLGPPDDPDNQILSVAVAFSASQVTLVTGDKNLRAKAKACNIRAKDWRSLQQSRGYTR